MLRITMDTTDGTSMSTQDSLLLIELLRQRFDVQSWGFEKVREIDSFAHYKLWVEVKRR